MGEAIRSLLRGGTGRTQAELTRRFVDTKAPPSHAVDPRPQRPTIDRSGQLRFWSPAADRPSHQTRGFLECPPDLPLIADEFGRLVRVKAYPANRRVAFDALGGVWTCETEHGTPLPEWRRKTTSIDQNGYVRVSIPRCHTHPRTIHVVLAMLFIGPRPEGCLVRHLDDNKLNNAVSNLAYGTHMDNYRDAVRNGRSGPGSRSRNKRLES